MEEMGMAEAGDVWGGSCWPGGGDCHLRGVLLPGRVVCSLPSAEKTGKQQPPP